MACGTDQYDAVRVNVTISPALPQGFPDTPDVHLAWYDPDNTVANVPALPPGNAGPGVRDNVATLSVETATLAFAPADNGTKTSYHRISGARFGDNFIVALHPNSGIEASYEFRPEGAGGDLVLKCMDLVDTSSGGGTPQWEEQWFVLGGNYRTSELTIWPTVDIDTDSDNNADVSRTLEEDLVENDAGHPGKRVFVNRDDDDENGKADTLDVNPLSVADNDLAEVVLDMGLSNYSGLEGYKLVLQYSAETRVWASNQKQALSGAQHDPVAHTYAWTIDSGWNSASPLPVSVFVEGLDVGTFTLSWMLKTPGESVVCSDSVKLSVENLVWPLPQQLYGDWNLRNTSDWNGIELQPA